MQKDGVYTCFFYALVASIGGLLFGYNTSVIAGALLFLGKDFGLYTFGKELIVSTILIGALFGALFGGIVTDQGRKNALFVTCGLYALGTILFITAQSFPVILLARFIGGLGLGLSSLSVPLYIAEISPPQNRGSLVSLNQLAITVGILIGYIFNYVFSPYESWRAMVGIQFIFILFFVVLLFKIPETPSYLASLGRLEVAKKLREKLGHKEKTEEGVIATKKEEKEKKSDLRRLLKKPLSYPFIIGVGLSIFQQITGIGTVIYYAPHIFIKAGFASSEATIIATLVLGIINVLMTLLAILLIDIVGRRPLLLVGLGGMAVSLATLATLFKLDAEYIGIGSVICLFCYISFFAIGIGPVAWLIISEIFPLEIRGKAMGIACSANWICGFIVSISFLTLLETLTTSYTFYLYTLISIFGAAFVYFFVFETKGKTFAEIQKHYLKN